MNWKICTAENPWDRVPGWRWQHPAAVEITTKDGYPGGDLVTYRCPHCDLEFEVELPQ